VRKLGEGGFGSAHLVEAKETGKEYVLKMIKCRTKDEKLEALKEMVAMRVVRDNFIVEFHEFWQSEGENEVYLVMEYCEDGDLFKRLRAAWENQQRLREGARAPRR
jgi:NIMA (never in mitosis gene a)-related kinase